MTQTTRLLACLLILCLAGHALASDPIGIYAIVDKVVLEPADGNPQRIQIWGAFCLAEAGGDRYAAPVRGYLYCKLPPEKANVALAEWSDLKSLAGTGQCIGFGSRYSKKPRTRTGQGPKNDRPLDPQRISQLIAQLDDQNQPRRDQAMEELQQAGAAATPALEMALKANPSGEVKGRLERILSNAEVDPYPTGFGMTKLRPEELRSPIDRLLFVPAAFSPAEGSVVAAGRVKLVAGNIADRHISPTYTFEIESESGAKETSDPVAAGDKQTEWSPKLQLKPGEKYTWRVFVQDDKATPDAATFRVK